VLVFAKGEKIPFADEEIDGRFIALPQDGTRMSKQDKVEALRWRRGDDDG
jgi:hypothetical protein